MGQVKGHPLLNWSDLKTYEWLNPDDPVFYEGIGEKIENSEEKYIRTGISMILFERMQTLRGFENLLMDFYIEKERVECLADRIVDIHIRLIENLSNRFPNKIDGIIFSDDWGTERDLIINPKLWRDFFKPQYKKIIDACHKAGWDVWLHSCGKINAIIGDFIELGLDVINLQQPTILGIEEIGKQFAGKICFESLCDIQKTLPFKSEEEIEQEAKCLIQNWGTPQGGFILSDYAGSEQLLGISEHKKRTMVDSFMKYDKWKEANAT